jgi:hypothetical protein
MKPIAARQHGVLDYSLGAFLLVSPWLFGFNDASTMATLTMVVVGMVVLLLSAMTDYPLGLLKFVPFQIHGIIETAGAIVLLISPWVVGFAHITAAKNIAVLVSIAWFGVVAMTNYSIYQTHRPIH